jgi:hypothetical protein
MSWDELNGEIPEASVEQRKKQAEAAKAIEQACSEALNRPEVRPLLDYLKRVVYAPSFLPGRDATDVAYREGYRALAIKILGEHHGR